MSFTHKYIVPDYYDGFICKGSSCRSTCCQGWNVSVSMQEYYKLLGIDCSSELRSRLDGAFQILERPEKSKYAVMCPKWDGDCPIHRADGLCGLQKECGEEALSTVCRYFPRSPRKDYDYECSCSNGCEAVIEILFCRNGKLTFSEESLTFDLPRAYIEQCPHLVPHYREIRKACIDMMQDRRFSISQRIIRLGGLMSTLSKSIGAKDDENIALALTQTEFFDDCDTSKNRKKDLYSQDIIEKLAEWCDDESPKLYEFDEAAKKLLKCGSEEKCRANYSHAKAHIFEHFPLIDLYLENIMVNHMFYECYPFSNENETLWDEYASLCAVFALLWYYIVTNMNDSGDASHLVDICAAVFRLVDHTNFDKCAASILYKNDCYSAQRLAALVRV